MNTRSESTKEIGVNTDPTAPDIDQRAPSDRDQMVQMMTSTPSETYWKLYTEARRPVMEKGLHDTLDRYQEIARLKEENRQRRKSLEEIKSFAVTVDEVLQENDTDSS